MNVITKKIELPDGRVIEIETGKLAKQAAGSAVVRMGGTVLLATVTAADEVKEGGVTDEEGKTLILRAVL